MDISLVYSTYNNPLPIELFQLCYDDIEDHFFNNCSSIPAKVVYKFLQRKKKPYYDGILDDIMRIVYEKNKENYNWHVENYILGFISIYIGDMDMMLEKEVGRFTFNTQVSKNTSEGLIADIVAKIKSTRTFKLCSIVVL